MTPETETNNTTDDSTDRLIGEVECRELTLAARSTRDGWEKAGKFPRRKKLSNNLVAWRLAEIRSWMQDPGTWPERNAAKLQTAA